MIDFSDFAYSEKALRFFEEFSKIPRGSGNTGAIADYLVNFAKERSLEVIRDESDNVIIKKPATPGYENHPGVILQGHTDIVALKTPDCPIDMEKEGLQLYRDGDLLRAKGTTLGGDDGVALAYAMAILDSDDIAHPDFEAVFTSDEETGLLGATALDAKNISGKMLINVDSDMEGIFTVGCAGGARVDIAMPLKSKTHISKIYTLTIGGYKGGHSGVEIDKNRGNAIKSAAEILTALENVEIAELPGEMKAIDAIKAVGLEDRANNFPSELSGGEQQRVAIARAIVKNPTLLLCDEPTGALDSKTGKKIIELLMNVNKNKDKIIVVVTHNAEIAKLADRVIKISDGKIISDENQKNPKKLQDIEL